jgi:hypothetical protein
MIDTRLMGDIAPAYAGHLLRLLDPIWVSRSSIPVRSDQEVAMLVVTGEGKDCRSGLRGTGEPA